MQHIYVIRHGIAEPRGNNRRHDPNRALTREGKHELVQVRRALGALGVTFDNLYTSPWLRAVETSHVLRPLVTGNAVVTDELARAPRGHLLRSFDGDTVACVGHEPWLSQLIAWCCTGRADNARAYILEKAGIAHLVGKGRPGRFKLVALWSPALLRRVAAP